ncbi:dual OB domain-containing protein [Burkholderia cepacia]|uniref:dual OB domain-containing protein n=1 Tax=Burkholderia cepacia TaxID=292 RepID=UPI000AF2DA56|nr:hypothetical protein [Burkholderia cepacia]
MVTKRIMCFANSRKPGGRCVAGREILDSGQLGQWIRPISSRGDESVWPSEQQYYGNAGYPGLLDELKVPLLQAKPEGCQTENWVLDPSKWWQKTGTTTWDIAASYAENTDVLFVNAGSSKTGSNNEIPITQSETLPSSLALIRVDGVQVQRLVYYEKVKLVGWFKHNGIGYGFDITDPVIEAKYQSEDDGYYDIGESLLCISLSKPITKTNGDGLDYRYKLIAGVMPKPEESA